jgi:hypothetical protein
VLAVGAGFWCAYEGRAELGGRTTRPAAAA